jgi:hypothetical protein
MKEEVRKQSAFSFFVFGEVDNLKKKNQIMYNNKIVGAFMEFL